MTFSTRRGRPRNPAPASDFGTPELRAKRHHRLTAEPIDLCLERALISERQHWCGLHLRWLHTVRYGAHSLTTDYRFTEKSMPGSDQPEWRQLREREFHDAVRLLRSQRLHDPVTRLAVFNEWPVFLHIGLRERAWNDAGLAERLDQALNQVRNGLELLARHWQRLPCDANASVHGN